MSFDVTLEPFTFGSTRYINELALCEQICFQFLTYFIVTQLNATNFFNVALRRCPCFFRMAKLWFNDTTSFYIIKTDLDRLITIVIHIFLLQYHTWSRLNDSYRNYITLRSKQLCHPKFFS
ncbi:hypothetical protein D3C71_1627800 [compost metagenome]